MSIPPVQTTEAPKTVTKPNRPFRILPSLMGSWKEEYFHTQDERDARGQELRNTTGEDVLLEFWDWSNTQDRINRGWAMDWVIQS